MNGTVSHMLASIRPATFTRHSLITCTNTEGNPLRYFDTFRNPIVKHCLCKLTLFVAYFLLIRCIESPGHNVAWWNQPDRHSISLHIS